jgi:hypothetical protein
MKLNTKGVSRGMMSTFLSIPAGAAADSRLVKILLCHASSRCTIPFILYLKLKGIFTSERHPRINFRDVFGLGSQICKYNLSLQIGMISVTYKESESQDWQM